MFIVFLLLGYIAGLACALIAWLAFGFSALAAFGIMSVSGTVAVFISAGVYVSLQSINTATERWIAARAFSRRLKSMEV
jgi:hypothetical protein